MSSSRFEACLQDQKKRIDESLDRLLPQPDEAPGILHESMRYSVFAGGKRLRPILAMAAYEIAGGRDEVILPVACGLELIHTYSLIHDDLPCMDDDDLRRGQPTNHKVYGEGMAVLAGDGLLTLAFECLLGRGINGRVSHEALGRLAGRIAAAVGSLGLVGGQVMDVAGFSQDRRLETLESICRLKTGRLIEVSLESGAILAGAEDSLVDILSRYGRALGLAFQITDDILNVIGDTKTLGKAVNSDASHHKITFPELLGLDQARSHARLQVEEAKHALSPLGAPAWFLTELADHVLERQS
ncbi:MAG: polyprenyl synthetase family protein [Acidobacteriales bacterium]|nr:polyprenyl synthetase family protein [Terriglobales bacterium]MCI0419196.1 polyprenyl synthetase family protein [Acidobacteriota bacterium]MCI0624426.1 polyprenyl synthetase family protein [Acidobacteriota bacterium]MCI0720815.1 polyprenyl synthetase family protein [Acidobacteriota bacterium]